MKLAGSLNIGALSYNTTDKLVPGYLKRFLNLQMLVFPITAFLVVPAVPGTTIITVMTALLFMVLPFASFEDKPSLYRDIFYFFCVIAALSFISQFINLVTNLKLVKPLILINRQDYTKTFYRKSHITQTLPLIVGFIIYTYVKYFSTERTLTYIYWGLRILCFYGIYEFMFYMLTGQNGDFMVNRTFGEGEKSASLFQTVSLGGISMLRFKSFTGEPSMFVFTTFPFWVLSFALNRKFDTYLLLGCLILTFSTTAYMCMILFGCFWIIYQRQFQLFYYLCIGVIVACFVLQLSAFQHMLDSIYDFVFAGKLDSSASARDRSNGFTNHLAYWASLNGLSQAFGIGFGYVRSTDYFSTIMVNNGLVGLFVFTAFVFHNLWLKIKNKLIAICYKTGLVMVYLIMMATVPEFAYPSLWIYIGLGYLIRKLDYESDSAKVTDYRQITKPVNYA